MPDRKYTVETGEGYFGIAKGSDGLCLAIATIDAYDWDSTDAVAAVDEPVGISLVEERHLDSDDDVLDQVTIADEDGVIVHVPPSVAREIVGYEDGCDVRAYERGERILLVAADADPTLGSSCVLCGDDLENALERDTGVCQTCTDAYDAEGSA